jgi:hypothetical protein
LGLQVPSPVPAQPALLHVEPDLGPLFEGQAEGTEPEMRTFANDETANALAFIPQAEAFESLDAFKAHLAERLPYNSASTRQRRANYILDRFFPGGRLDAPLAYYGARCSTQDDLKPAIFYELLNREPLPAKIAEELIWPALPLGRIDREQVRELVLRYLPDVGPASQAKILQSVFNAWTILSVASADGTSLRFQVHAGTLAAFSYVLAAQFPRPGMYSFAALENGPMRHWLLWDREWMRRQLYNLRDLGIIAKVSEIDAMRQFTISLDQSAALRQYFSQSPEDFSTLREKPEVDM